MSRYSQTNVSTITGVNSELSKIATSIASLVDRDGGTPNFMLADFDLNSNDVLNVKALDTDALSINGVDVTSSGAVTTTLPAQSGNGGKLLTTNGGAASWVHSLEPANIKDYGAVGDGVVDDTTAINNALSANDTILIPEGDYLPFLFSQSNKTVILQGRVTFKLPDNTSSGVETVAFAAFEVTGNNNDFFGNVYIDGNPANNSSASTNTSDLKGSFAMQGDNNTWNGNVVVLGAYWVGYSIGADDSSVTLNFVHSGTAINISSDHYPFAMWSCTDCHVNNVLSKDTTQTLVHRIRTGTQSGSTKECKNLSIGTIKGSDMVGVFEIKTINMQVDTINLAGWKCEEAKDFQVGKSISEGCTIEVIGFALISVDGFQADSITVKDFNGSLTADSAVFIGGKRISIGSISVDGNLATGEDVLIRSFQDVDIGRISLTNPASTSIGFKMDQNVAYLPQERMNIGSIISVGHSVTDVEFQSYRTLDANVGYINDDAIVNADLDGVQGKGASYTGIVGVTLTPTTSGTITLNQSSLAYTRMGRTVHVQGRVRAGSVSSPVGVVTLAGLPFNVVDLTSLSEISATGFFGQNFVSFAAGAYTGNTNTSTTTATLQIDAAEFQANTILIFDFTYVTDD